MRDELVGRDERAAVGRAGELEALVEEAQHGAGEHLPQRRDAGGEVPIAPMAMSIGNEESLTEPQLYASEATRDDDKDVR